MDRSQSLIDKMSPTPEGMDRCSFYQSLDCIFIYRQPSYICGVKQKNMIVAHKKQDNTLKIYPQLVWQKVFK